MCSPHPSICILTPNGNSSGATGVVWGLMVGWGIGCGTSAGVRDPDCFGGTACVSTSNGCPRLTQDATSGLSFLRPPQLSSPLSLCCPHPSVELCHRALGPVWALGMDWDGAVVVQPQTEIKAASDVLPVCVPVMLPLPRSDVVLGLSHFSVSKPSFRLGCGSPCPSVELCCEAGGAGVITQLRLGRVQRQAGETRQPLGRLSVHPLHPASGASKQARSP